MSVEIRDDNYFYVECLIADVAADDRIYLTCHYDEKPPNDYSAVHATVYSQRPTAMNIVYDNGIEAYINSLRNCKLYKLVPNRKIRDQIDNMSEL